MNRIISQYLAGMEFGKLTLFQGLGLLPLFHWEYEGLDHLTLKEALEQDVLLISEVSHGGSVPELKVINRGKAAVLLLDGEELAGAKQNRVLNTTILVRGNSEVIIPVSCTEQGRWSYKSEHFSDSGIMMSRNLRSMKNLSVSESLRAERGFQSDQGRIWDGIEALHAEAKTTSQTGAMRDAYEGKANELGNCIEEFPCLESQCGMLVFINGSVAGLDVIPCLPAYRSLHSKLLTSYAMEAEVNQRDGASPPTAEKGKRFLAKIGLCVESRFRSAGEGDDFRYTAPGVVGSALVAREKLVHMAFFKTTVEKEHERMSTLSRRRNNRQWTQ